MSSPFSISFAGRNSGEWMSVGSSWIPQECVCSLLPILWHSCFPSSPCHHIWLIGWLSASVCGHPLCACVWICALMHPRVIPDGLKKRFCLRTLPSGERETYFQGLEGCSHDHEYSIEGQVPLEAEAGAVCFPLPPPPPFVSSCELSVSNSHCNRHGDPLTWGAGPHEPLQHQSSLPPRLHHPLCGHGM